MMKKMLALSLAILALLTLFGCSAPQEPEYDYTAEEIAAAIREAYGDNYMPNFAIEQDMLTSTFGLDTSLVADIVAEMPMIGFHPDRVVIVKAVSGKGADVEAQLVEARRVMVEDAVQYPANLAKVNAAKVLRHGDYVALLLVGAVDDVSETEEDAAAFAEAEVQKAVDAFNAFFEK